MKYTVPSKLCFFASAAAAPSSIAVWPSWPQACILPAIFDACVTPDFSWMCSASRSARSPIASLPEPLRRTPTTPVFASPVCTSSPNERSLSATNAAVASSSNAVSGCAWMWWRQAFMSGTSAVISGTSFMGPRAKTWRAKARC